jgi:hypothetical protein
VRLCDAAVARRQPLDAEPMMLPIMQAPMFTGAMLGGAASKVGALRSTFVADACTGSGLAP